MGELTQPEGWTPNSGDFGGEGDELGGGLVYGFVEGDEGEEVDGFEDQADGGGGGGHAEGDVLGAEELGEADDQGDAGGGDVGAAGEIEDDAAGSEVGDFEELVPGFIGDGGVEFADEGGDDELIAPAMIDLHGTPFSRR